MNLHLNERPSIELTHMNSEKKVRKNIPPDVNSVGVHGRWSPHFPSEKPKIPVSTTCRSFHRKIQPKRRLKHCKPNQHYKPSHLGHLSGVPPKLGDLRSWWLLLSYIPWGMILLQVPQDFPEFQSDPSRVPKSWGDAAKRTESAWLNFTSNSGPAPLFLDRPAFFDPIKKRQRKNTWIIPNNK